MDNEILIWLYDIKSAIEEIESFFNEGDKKFELFIVDIKTKRAVERNIEIIGEAVNRILKKDKNFNITNARKIVDSRNRIPDEGFLVNKIYYNDLKKWTTPLQNWALTVQQLAIKFGDRVKIDLIA